MRAPTRFLAIQWKRNETILCFQRCTWHGTPKPTPTQWNQTYTCPLSTRGSQHATLTLAHSCTQGWYSTHTFCLTSLVAHSRSPALKSSWKKTLAKTVGARSAHKAMRRAMVRRKNEDEWQKRSQWRVTRVTNKQIEPSSGDDVLWCKSYQI